MLFSYFNFKEIATATMILFAVIDIVGSVPIIIDLRQKTGHIQSEKASLVSLVDSDRFQATMRSRAPITVAPVLAMCEDHCEGP